MTSVEPIVIDDEYKIEKDIYGEHSKSEVILSPIRLLIVVIGSRNFAQKGETKRWEISSRKTFAEETSRECRY